MKKIIEIYLEDILNSIKKIEAFLKDMTFEIFIQDIKTQDVVIRNFEVIGEAANRLPEQFLAEHPSFPSREAISMRNFLIHDYDTINLEVIWKTIQIDIPALKKEILVLLSTKGS